MRLLLALLLCAASAFAVVTRLYMKDGTYQMVREYQRAADRVKFYSTERSEWEEVPLDLVDLRRTESEIAETKAAIAGDAKTLGEEDQAVHAQQQETRKIPQDPGVYTLGANSQLTVFKQADVKVHTDKGRSLLRMAVPVPMIPGKATVELEQEHAAQLVHDDRQEFFLQLSKEERFGIIRLTPHRGVRIAERLSIVAAANLTDEQVDEVESFRKQLSEGGLYKIWPTKPLTTGEYAVIEFTPGKVEPQIWDFQFK